MSKQKEIREVIDLYTDDACLYPNKTCVWCSKEGYCNSDNDSYTCLMKCLGDLGVVIKVDRELPTFYTSKMPTCEKGLDCSFIEPLIEK